jgi:hypothetical protein
MSEETAEAAEDLEPQDGDEAEAEDGEDEAG